MQRRTSRPSVSQRTCDVALALSLLVFLWCVRPSLTYGWIGLDDKALVAHFKGANFARVWEYDPFAHLRPVKNLYFWWLAQFPGQLLWLRALNILAASACAWLIRSYGLALSMSPSTAAAAAALWLLNPTSAVGVVWLSASNYLYALLGSLLYLFLLHRAAGCASKTRFRVLGVLAHVALLFGVLSHELAMLTPVWAVMRATYPTPRRSHVLSKHLVLGGLAVLAVPLTLRLSLSAPELGYRSTLSPLQLMASAPYSFLQNVRLWLWLPGRFGVLLSQQGALSPLLCVGTWLGTVGLVWLAWRVSAPASPARLALVWVVLFLLPVINLLPLGVTPVAMHYLIVPAVGLAWLVASALERATRWGSAAPLGLAAAVIAIWSPAYQSSVRAFHDEVALYQTSVGNYPQNPEVRVNLIAAYVEAGQNERANELLHESLAQAPEHPGLLRHQLLSLLRSEHTDEALAWFERHADATHNDADLSLRRALLLRGLGRDSEAETTFKHALSISRDPEIRAHAGYQLANLQVQSGRLVEAQSLLRKLHGELPDNAEITLALKLIDDVLR